MCLVHLIVVELGFACCCIAVNVVYPFRLCVLVCWLTDRLIRLSDNCINIFIARRYAKRGIWRRPVSVVCLSHSGIVSKRLNVGSGPKITGKRYCQPARRRRR